MPFFSPLEQFNSFILIPLFPSFLGEYIDFSFSSVIFPLFFLNLILVGLFYIYKSSLKLVPNVWQIIFENLYFFINKLIYQQIGNKGLIFLPLMMTLFFFVLLSNLLGLVPFGFALTSHIVVIFLLSFVLALAIFQIGILIHGLNFMKLFSPEAPLFLIPLLVLIEFFSYLIRAFSLSVRLSANIMSGHVLFFIVITAMINFSYINFWHFFVFSTVILLLFLLEIAVAFLQAYVFVVLVCIYFADSFNLH